MQGKRAYQEMSMKDKPKKEGDYFMVYSDHDSKVMSTAYFDGKEWKTGAKDDMILWLMPMSLSSLLGHKKKNIEAEGDNEIRSKWSTNDLLPCPFCNTAPEWIGIVHPDARFRLKCFNCRFLLIDDRRDKVVSLWNSRAYTLSLSLKEVSSEELLDWVDKMRSSSSKTHSELLSAFKKKILSLTNTKASQYKAFQE